jgi:hypothetical protein
VAWLATDDGETTVSVNIAAEWRGKRYGVQLICLVSQQAIGPISAYIKRGNTASIHAFTSAGYRFVEETVLEGHAAVRYVWP